MKALEDKDKSLHRYKGRKRERERERERQRESEREDKRGRKRGSENKRCIIVGFMPPDLMN